MGFLSNGRCSGLLPRQHTGGAKVGRGRRSGRWVSAALSILVESLARQPVLRGSCRAMNTNILTTDRIHPLRTRLAGRRIERGDPGWAAATGTFDPTITQGARRRRDAGDRRGVVAIVDFRSRARLAGRPSADRPQRQAAGVARGRHPRAHGRAGRRRDRPRAPRRPRAGRSAVGGRRAPPPPRPGSPPCTARRATSASPVTRSAAESAGTRASMAWPPTASPRSRWSRLRVGCAASIMITIPPCSGRCAAAAATSGSSPRWRSRCCRSRRCTRACCSSRVGAPPRS
jgi:hypothetical protein